MVAEHTPTLGSKLFTLGSTYDDGLGLRLGKSVGAAWEGAFQALLADRRRLFGGVAVQTLRDKRDSVAGTTRLISKNRWDVSGNGQSIAQTLSADGTVFVHCGAGVGRTGAMVGAYLVDQGELSGSAALRRNLAVGPPSLEQIAFVAKMGHGSPDKPGTLVVDEDEIMEQELVSGIAYSRDEAKITLLKVADRPGIETMDISVTRNAFGRQVDSFEADLDVPSVGERPFHGVFIRAPVIDDRLHAERLDGRAKRTHRLPWTGLPDGAFVRQWLADADGGLGNVRGLSVTSVSDGPPVAYLLTADGVHRLVLE